MVETVDSGAGDVVVEVSGETLVVAVVSSDGRRASSFMSMPVAAVATVTVPSTATVANAMARSAMRDAMDKLGLSPGRRAPGT